MSAIRRAQTTECKNEIVRLACQVQEQIENKHEEGLFRTRIKASCPITKRNEQVSCLPQKDFVSLIENLNKTQKNEKNESDDVSVKMVMQRNDVRDLEFCIDICVSFNQHKYAAYNQKLKSCYCFKNLTNDLLLGNSNCDAKNQDNIVHIYYTGLQSINYKL